MPYLPISELEKMGFNSLGENVFISDKASIYNCKNITIGSNVRIDDFCVISAGSEGIIIGDYVHIAVFTSLIGKANITISDFCNLSSRVSVYSSSDDYSGNMMTNPMIPDEYKTVIHKGIFMDKHVIVGCGSVILPGVVLGQGVAIGALSFVTTDCDAFGIYAGVPARKIKDRKMDLLALATRFLSSIKNIAL
jgi:galactoside O-acetyltransferase